MDLGMKWWIITGTDWHTDIRETEGTRMSIAMKRVKDLQTRTTSIHKFK